MVEGLVFGESYFGVRFPVLEGVQTRNELMGILELFFLLINGFFVVIFVGLADFVGDDPFLGQILDFFGSFIEVLLCFLLMFKVSCFHFAQVLT